MQVQDIIDKLLKVYESISKAHEHNERLIKISSDSKDHLSFFFFYHLKYVVSCSNVQHYIVSDSGELIQSFSNQRVRVSILDSFLIEISIVDAEMKIVILFLSKQDQCISQGEQYTYKAF